MDCAQQKLPAEKNRRSAPQREHAPYCGWLGTVQAYPMGEGRTESSVSISVCQDAAAPLAWPGPRHCAHGGE